MLFKQFEIIKRNKIKKFLENHEQYISDYRFGNHAKQGSRSICMN